MSFRLRVFLLVMLVAVTAIGATAWLTLSLASKRVSDAVAASKRDTAVITRTLGDFAHDRGTWQGVDGRVRELSDEYRVRIRMATINGNVIVDSDHLAQRAARPTLGTANLVDPRPKLKIPERVFPADPANEKVVFERARFARNWVQEALRDYRYTVHLTTCVWNGYKQVLPLIEGENGVATANAVSRDFIDCDKQAAVRADEGVASDAAGLETCPITDERFRACLEGEFSDRVAQVGPEPLQLFLGGIDSEPADLLGTPLIIAAGAVTLLALVGTALIARQVSRPIRSLTAASRRLTDGDFDARVTVGGNDELGQLSYSFNRMAEAIQHAEEDQRRLVASVAHELRTPLSNLRGYLEALQDGVVRPSPELFGSLYEEVLLQRRILDDLQDLALAEAGSLAYRREPTDLAELVAMSARAHLAVAEEAGVALTAYANNSLPVLVDQDRIRQVLGNLITNGVRYTPAGGTLTLYAYASAGQAVVEVTDTGRGIAEGDLPHVFKRFWRADAARDRASGGSGLGLTIARQITVDHQGQLRVSSRLGVGTTFTLALPLNA
ncbi:sensor histidine kinase [Virgisporangium ochraceum]|uniref:histidine kinase n=1 Tax=Virgisporangium ochraceum TaxID=65505 RepID=A0A8J4EA03_9ACTN|nr:ATP-binding protein [Virgisporangium ochraceum]GIJ67795.1 two-component sensor histidine kinase [Virgisporangium ochraceum]